MWEVARHSPTRVQWSGTGELVCTAATPELAQQIAERCASDPGPLIREACRLEMECDRLRRLVAGTKE